MQHVASAAISNHFDLSKIKPLPGTFLERVVTEQTDAEYYEKVKIVTSTVEWFESWQAWQQRLLIATLVNTIPSKKLKFLSSAFESVYHGDFPSEAPLELKYIRNTRRRSTVVDVSHLQTGMQQIYNKVKIFTPTPFKRTFTSFERAQWLLDHYVALIRQRCDLGDIELYDMKDLEDTQKQFHDHLAELNDAESSLPQISAGRPKSPPKSDQLVDFKNKINRQVNKLKEIQSQQKLPKIKNKQSDSSLCLTDIGTEDYFSISSNPNLALRTTFPSQTGSDFYKTVHMVKNKAILPTSKQIYKKNKFRSFRDDVIKAQRDSLKDLYLRQMGLILKSVQHWSSEEKVDLLLKFTSDDQKPDVVRFLASCIRFSLVQAQHREQSFGLLPETFWFNVFRRLSLEDIFNVEKVNHQFKHLCNLERMWKVLIHEMACGYDIVNMIQKVEKLVPEKEGVDWRKTFFLLRNYLLHEDPDIDQLIDQPPPKKSYRFKKKKALKERRSHSTSFENLWIEMFPNHSTCQLQEIERMGKESSNKKGKLNPTWKNMVNQLGNSYRIPRLSHRIKLKMSKKRHHINWQACFNVLKEFWDGNMKGLDDLLDVDLYAVVDGDNNDDVNSSEEEQSVVIKPPASDKERQVSGKGDKKAEVYNSNLISLRTKLAKVSTHIEEMKAKQKDKARLAKARAAYRGGAKDKDALRVSFTRNREDDDEEEESKKTKSKKEKKEEYSGANDDEDELLRFMNDEDGDDDNDNDKYGFGGKYDDGRLNPVDRLDRQISKMLGKGNQEFCFDAFEVDTPQNDKQIDDYRRSGQHFYVDYKIIGARNKKNEKLDFKVMRIFRVLAFESENTRAITSVLCHGDKIYSGDAYGHISVRTPYGELIKTYPKYLKGSVQNMTIGANERCQRLFTVSWDTTVCVWNTAKGKVIRSLRGHTNSVTGVAIDESYIVTCSHDHTVRVWDITRYNNIRTMKVHPDRINCLCLNKKRIITAGNDMKICVTNADTGKLLKTFQVEKNSINSLATQHEMVIGGDAAGWAFIWSLSKEDCKPVASFLAHRDSVNAIKFYNDRFFTASSDRHIKEWDLLTLKCVRIFQGHTMEIFSLAICDRFMVSGSRDGSTRVWWWNNPKSYHKV